MYVINGFRDLTTNVKFEWEQKLYKTYEGYNN